MTRVQFKKKWENYWYYYKYPTLIGLFIAVAVAVLVSQCAAQKHPDSNVLLITGSQALTEQRTQALEQVFASYGTDFNRDGQKLANFTEIWFMKGLSTDVRIAMQDRLIVDLQNADAILFVMDDQGYQTVKKQNLFQRIDSVVPGAPTSDGYRIPLSDFRALHSRADLTNGLSVAVRVFTVTEKNKAYYTSQIAELKALLNGK